MSDYGNPVKVRNKDIPVLADVFPIMQEIRKIEERRKWQYERMFNITQCLSGMPGSGSSPRGLDEAFALLSEIDDEYKQRCKEYSRQVKKAQRILDSIESRTMRVFVMMKYVMDVPDVEIRKDLNMSRRGIERAKENIENAPCMASVVWRERYVLETDEKMC